MKKNILNILAMLSLFIFGGCEAVGANAATHTRISPAQAIEMMAQDNVIIIDVRNQAEFDGGHIPNAVLLPVSDIELRANEVIPNRDMTILLYCRSGARSSNAAGTLAGMGFTAVYDFGGILSWPGEIVFP